MYDVFVFSMWAAIYSLIFAVSFTIFYFFSGLGMGMVKHAIRYELTMSFPEIFGDMEIVSFEMRKIMVYLMQERSEKRFAYLDPFHSYNKSDNKDGVTQASDSRSQTPKLQHASS